MTWWPTPAEKQGACNTCRHFYKVHHADPQLLPCPCCDQGPEAWQTPVGGNK